MNIFRYVGGLLWWNVFLKSIDAQCFDIDNFVETYEHCGNRQRWKCPVCEKPISVQDLEVCSLTRDFFLPKATENKYLVEMKASGEWQICGTEQCPVEEIISDQQPPQPPLPIEVFSAE